MRRLMTKTCTVLVVLSLGTGCWHKRQLTVEPDRVAPGRTVRISSQQATFADVSTIDVEFDGRRAAISQVPDKQTIVVVVPRLDPGRVTVTVRDKGSLVGSGDVTIVHPSKRRLSLTYTDGAIELDRVLPYTGHFDRPAPGGMRLSYDVLNEKGVVIHMGAIPLPASRGVEVFGDPEEGGSIQRLPRGGRIRFAVKIPYQAGKTVVRFYELEPGRDLDDPDRKFIRELEIDDK